MTAQIIDLKVDTKLDCPPERMLQKALEADLKEVVIIGLDQDDECWLSSSTSNVPTVLYTLEMAKKKLLDMMDK